MALQGYNCLVKVQSSGVAMTDEATTTGDNITYQITNSAKRIIDPNTAVVVEDSGVPTTESYTINWLDGSVTFTGSGSRTITITGAYMSPATVASAKQYSFEGSADMLDKTQFQDTVRQFEAGLVSGSATIGRFFDVDDLFTDAILAGEIFIVEFYVDGSNKVAFYGVASGVDTEAPVEQLIEESITFQVTTDIGV